MGLLDNLLKSIVNNPGSGATPTTVTPVQQSVAAQEAAKPVAKAAGQSTETNPVKALRGVTKKTPAQTATTPAQTQTPAQKAAQKPVVLPTGAVVTLAQSPAQKAAMSPAKSTEATKPKVSETAARISAESLKGMSAQESFDALRGVTGDSSRVFRGSQNLVAQAETINKLYNETVTPAWERLQRAKSAYESGKGSFEAYTSAYNDYVDVFNTYDPLQRAWQDAMKMGSQAYWIDTDLDELASTLDLYNTALTEGQTQIASLGERYTTAQQAYTTSVDAFKQRQTEYEAAVKALKTAEKAYKRGAKGSEAQYQKTWDAYEAALAAYNTSYDACVTAGHSLSELEGQYNAQMLYLTEIAGIDQYGSETYQKRYLGAHPEIAWTSQLGLTYGDEDSVQAKLSEYMQDGSVDLLNRPEVNTSELKKAGWRNAGEGTATVFSSTFSSYDFMTPAEARRTDSTAANFTPIVVGEDGKVERILSPDELSEYARGVLLEGKDDELGLQIGAIFTGADSLYDAEHAAENIHKLHEVVVSGEYNSGNLVLNDTSFTQIYSHIKELQADNADGKNNQEIAFYYRIMNSGLAVANLNRAEFDRASEFFTESQDEATRKMNEISDQLLASLPPEEVAKLNNPGAMAAFEQELMKNDEYAAAKAQKEDAQYWIQQITQREEDATYERLFSKLPEHASTYLDNLIEAYAEKGDTAANQTVLRTVLASKGYDDEQIQAVFDYAKRKGDAIRQENIKKKWKDWSLSLSESLAGADEAIIRGNVAADWGGAPPQIVEDALKTAEDLSGSNDPAVVSASLVTWPIQLVTSIASAGGSIDLLVQEGARLAGIVKKDPFTGKYAPLNYNSAMQTPYTVTRALSEAQYERTFDALYDELGDVVKAEKRAQVYQNWYDLTQSMGQSTVVLALSMAGVPGSMLLLSSTAATQTMHEAHENGYSDGYAVASGLAAGFAEYITEKVSIEGLMKTASAGARGLSGKALWAQLGINLGQQVISEASEEGASDVVNLLADELMLRFLNGGVSQMRMDVMHAQQNDPSLSYEDAVKNWWGNWTKQTMQDMMYGGISGGIMGGGTMAISGARSASRMSQLGEQIRANGGVGILMDYATAVDTMILEANRIDLSKGLDTDLQIGRAAVRLKENVVLAGIQERLTQLGEENITPELLSGINALAADERLLPGENRAVRDSEHGRQVAQELAEYVDQKATAPEWTQGFDEEMQSLEAMFTGSESAAVFNANRANTLELRWQNTQQANPDATVMTPIGDTIEAAGADAKVAHQQGQIMAKILSGEELTKSEMKAFDLNNPAVRKVFVDRTGLTAMPEKIAPKLKQSYVNRVIAESKLVKANQQALGEGSAMLEELNREKSRARTQALKDSQKPNPMGEAIEGEKRKLQTRAENNAEHEAEKTSEYAARSSDAARRAAIPTEGRLPTDIFAQVRQQSGNPSLLGLTAFAQQYRIDLSDTVTLDNQYRMYLKNAGLTNAEISAMVTAGRMSLERTANERSKNNDNLRRSSGGRGLGSDGREGTGRVHAPESSEGKGRTGSAYDLGIPNGSRNGNLRELTEQDISDSALLPRVRELMTRAGIEARNVHFVQGNGDYIRVQNASGKDAIVRGLYNTDTHSVWILVDDPSEAAIPPDRIALHELLHHMVSVQPSLLDTIKEKLQAAGVLSEVERMARERMSTGIYTTADLNRYVEEIVADAFAGINTFRKQNTAQLGKIVRDAFAQAMLSSPADIIAAEETAPDIRASSVEIPESAKDRHHDDLGRELSPQMDEYMAKSWMRIGPDGKPGLNNPLTNMYRGGGGGYEIFGFRGDDSSPNTDYIWWTDRVEVARTYSQGKEGMATQISHGQQHTAERQEIAELEREYLSSKPLAMFSSERKAELERIEKRLRELHTQIEPSSVDVYAPEPGRNVWSHEVKSAEDVRALIERFGAMNRKANLETLSREELIDRIVRPEFEKTRKALTLANQILNEASADESFDEEADWDFEPEIDPNSEYSVDETEEDDGPPKWWEMEPDDTTEAGSSIGGVLSELINEPAFSDASNDLDSMTDFFDTVMDYLDPSVDYEMFNAIEQAASQSDELRALADEFKSYGYNWSDLRQVSAMGTEALLNNTDTFYVLNVSGLGITKLFSSEKSRLAFGRELGNAIGTRGIYNCYLNIEKPFIADAHGGGYWDWKKLSDEQFPEKQQIIEFTEAERRGAIDDLHSENIVEWAINQRDENGDPKYDGVILLNVVDPYDVAGNTQMGRVVGDASSTVAVTWNKNSPKSVANKNPTSGPRITYSAVEEIENAGSNVKQTARKIKAQQDSQAKSEQLNQAKHNAPGTMEKAQAAANGQKRVRYDHSKSFAEQVDDYINGVFPLDDSLVIGTTPPILRDLGLPNLPLTYAGGHLQRVLNVYADAQSQIADPMSDALTFKDPTDFDHSFGPEILKQLPNALENPIAVIRSEKQPSKSIVVLSEYTYSGKPMLAAFEINGYAWDNSRKIDAYAVTSFYRSTYAEELLRNAIQVENEDNVVGVYFLDKEKTAALVGDHEILRPVHSELRNGLLYHTLSDPKAEVKPRIGNNTQTKQFEHWLGNSTLKNSDGSPKVLYHVTETDRASMEGIGYIVTEKGENSSQQVYGKLEKPLKLNGELAGTDAKSIVNQILRSGFASSLKNRTAVRGQLARIAASNAARANKELVSYLKKLGYDGIQYNAGNGKGYILFDANQIKAVDNTGLYSTDSNNIRYSSTEEKVHRQEQVRRINRALKKHNSSVRVDTNSDLSGAIDYALQEKEAKLLKAAEKAKVDAEWKVKMAQSDGEQKLKAAQRIWRDKLDYTTKTDKQWARGMKSSERNAGKKETKRRVKEAVTMERKVHSLPATAAMSNRRAVRRAEQVPINDNQVIATPLPLPDKSGIELPKSAAEFRGLAWQGYDTFYRAFVNATQEVDRMAKLQTRTDNLSVWTNIVRASGSTIERFYTDAMLDQQGNAIGPSMEETFLCRDADGKYDQKLQNALNDYMFHKHNIDRMSLKSRAIDRVHAFEQQYPWLTELSDKEFGALVADDVPIAKEYARLLKEANEAVDKPVLPDIDGKPVTAATSQRVVDVYESEMPWLKEKAQEIYTWWDVFMREWAVGTSITEKQYEHMREIYPHYVPTYRAEKGQHAGYISANATGLSSGEMVKKAKGSTAPLQAMEDQFVRSMSQIVKNNRQNGLLRTLVEELLYDEEGVFSKYGVFDWENANASLKNDLWDFADETEASSVEKVKVDGKEAYHISCWVDGVKMSAYVNRAMFEGLNFLFGRHSDAYNKIAKAGRKITQPMKNMITGYNPFFAVKNVIRDQHTALTNSNAGIAYWKYVGQASAKMATNDRDWINFQALGGVSANETRVDGGFAQAMHPNTGVKKAVETGKEILGKPGEWSESVSRFAEYLATLDMLGGDTYENRLAAIRAAAEVTVDFGRAGYVGRLINMWVPYWNANVQGLDKAIRNIAEQPDVKSMLARTSRAFLVNAIPAALQIALIHALKRDKDYEELNDQQKDNYYCIPVPGKEHKFLKIPKSQDWGAFISTPILRIWEGVNGRDDPMEGWFESAVLPQLPFDMRDLGLGVEMPVLMPIFLDDLFDLASNKNWAGSAIIPYNLQKVSPKEQYDADTSMLAYYFGQLFDASPMAVDYIIDNYMGNFWGVAAKSVPLTPLVSRGLVTGETKYSDRAIDAVSTIMSPFISDNRYSNAAMANYYEMLNTLEQEVTDAAAHGDKKDAEHYAIYEALTQTGGYVDQIRALTSEAKSQIKGENQANIRWEAAGLADIALEFVEKCLNGEIKDPKLWMTYHGYGDRIMAEAEALQKYDGEFNFSGALGKPTVIYDRSGATDIKYNLKDDPEAQQEYARLRAEEYQKALNTVISDSKYKSLSATEKAARLEEAKRIGLKKADQRMLQYLKGEGIKGESVGKTDYSTEERAAAYSVSWLLGENGAYKPTLTDAFLDLYDYNDQYSFIPADSARKTFKDQSDNSKVYTLTTAQQKKYADMYHDMITKYYDTVMASPEYKAAGRELRAAMLSRAKTYANDDIKEQFDAWLKQTGATSVAQEKASGEISLEAKYAIQRALGDDHAMKQEVTDELVRLYQYSDVGEVEFFPITTAPKQYVDDRDKSKSYVWILDDDQREVYMSMMFDIYQRNVIKVMQSSAYKSADDYGKAQLLCDVRSRLSGEVQSEFKHWLRTTGAKRTYRNSPEAQAQAADVAAAGQIVDGILGKARTYKQFNKARGY